MSLTLDEVGSLNTEFIQLSTFKETGNGDTVCSFFRIFYTKQREDQDLSSPEVSADFMQDNLFEVKELEEYSDYINDNSVMMSRLTGRMMYIPKSDSSIEGRYDYISYPGMYYSGVAVDPLNITFYAIPFASSPNDRPPNPKLPLATSNVKTYLETLVKSSAEDWDAYKFSIETPDDGNDELITIREKPLSANSKRFDAEALLYLSMTTTEYETYVENELNQFNRELHPVFIKLQSSVAEFPPTNSDIYSKDVIQRNIKIAGYGMQSSVLEVDISNVNFYCLHSSLNMFFQTPLSTGSVLWAQAVLESEEIPGIKISYSSTGTQEDLKRRTEIEMALKLVKKFMPEEYNELIRIFSKDKIEYVPTFKVLFPINSPPNLGEEGENKVFDKYEKVNTRYSLEIAFETGFSSIDIGGKTKTDNKLDCKLTDYNNPGTPISQTVKSDNDIESVLTSETVNKNAYETIAVNSNATPKQIEEGYTPEIRVRIEDEFNPNYAVDSEKTAYTDIPGAERAIFKSELKCVINEEIRDSSVFSHDDFTFGTTYLSGQNPITTQNKFFGDFSGISPYLLQLASLIAHEMGHVILQITNPMLPRAWHVLEDSYGAPPNDPNMSPAPDSGTAPSYTAEGHLEGNPEGNRSARYEYFFGKSLVQDGMWNYAAEVIGNTSSALNRDVDLYNLKTSIVPSYLNAEPDDDQNPVSIIYSVNKYLSGNLGVDEVELPPPTDIPPP